MKSEYFILVYTHSLVLVIQAIWLAGYLGLWRLFTALGGELRQNEIAVVNWVFCQSFILKPFWKYTNIQVLMTLKARKDFMVFKSESMQKSTKIADSWQGSKNQNRSSFVDW